MSDTLDWKLIDPVTGKVNLDEWRMRVLVKTPVGECPLDGGLLMPEHAERVGKTRTELQMECANVACRHRMVVKAEKTLREPATAAA